jgi:preprotein translocase subunit YajC
MSLFIASAYANTAAPAGSGMVSQLVMIAGFIAIFYFLIWRPQAKRTKEHRMLIESLGIGSEIIFCRWLNGPCDQSGW